MATLKNLVDETTNIKNELVECHTNLKNNLITKGIEAGSLDKLSVLVGKIKNITATYITAGDSISLYKDTKTYSLSKITEYTYFPIEYVFMANGDYRLSTDCKANGTSYYAYVKFVILDENDLIVYEKEFSNKGVNIVTVTTDVANVKKGYKFKLMGKTHASGMTYIDETNVLCNLEWR